MRGLSVPPLVHVLLVLGVLLLTLLDRWPSLLRDTAGVQGAPLLPVSSRQLLHGKDTHGSDFKRSGTRSKSIGLDAHLLQHSKVEIGEGRVVLGIVPHIAAMGVPASGKNDRIVSRVVSGAVAEVRSEDCKGTIEQSPLSFRLALQPRQEPLETGHDFRFDPHQLGNLRLVAAVVGQVMVLGLDPVDLGYAVIVLNEPRAGAYGLTDSNSSMGFSGSVKR